MKNARYRIVYALIWFLTLPPLPVLYLFSDFLYIINYYVVKYRKNVVFQNLRNAFPEKSNKEIKRIAKTFYRHLSDFLIEAIKSIHLTQKQYDKRCTFKNLELLEELYLKGKDVALISGHYANWEWMLIFPSKIRHTPLTIYHPLKNKYSDMLINSVRGKYGMLLIPMNQIFREVISRMEKGEQILIWYLGDQRPPRHNKFWTPFLNQDTGFYQGAEKMAMKFNQAVVFMDIQKIKRGYYEYSFELLFLNGNETSEFEITEKQAKILEEKIKERPEFWLWSHKRWKFKRNETLNNG